MFWEYEHMRAKLPVDVYIDEEVGWQDVDPSDDTDAS